MGGVKMDIKLLVSIFFKNRCKGTKNFTYMQISRLFFCKKANKPLFLQKKQQKEYIYIVYILYKACFCQKLRFILG